MMFLKSDRSIFFKRFFKLVCAQITYIFYKIKVSFCHRIKQKRFAQRSCAIQPVFILLQYTGAKCRIKKRKHRIFRKITFFHNLFPCHRSFAYSLQYIKINQGSKSLKRHRRKRYFLSLG